jgi:NAD(P)-dependent dehydrogenase (short-subunit alcohol dehydrogenase family)
MTQKKALVTGANKGLGLEMAKQLAQQGINVTITSRDKNRGESAVSQLKKEGIHVEMKLLDVSNSRDVERFIKEFASENTSLDILINNAGIEIEGGFGGNSVATVSRATVETTFATNLFGLVQLTQGLLPFILKSNAGRIVNLSSIMGSLTIHSIKGGDLWNVKPFAYDASKTALNQFTVHLAQHLDGTNASVVSAHPGWVKTDLGSEYAPMDVAQGAKTGVDLALAKDTSFNGKYIHLGQELPW